MSRKIDALDRKIVESLSRDGRQSFRKLARSLKVSIATAISRVKKLEQEGIIRGYTIRADSEKLGYDLTAVIEVSVSKGRLVDVERMIAAMEAVTCVYDITGDTDVVLIAKFQGRKDLNSFVKALLAIEHVEHTNTRIVLNTVKEEVNLPGAVRT